MVHLLQPKQLSLILSSDIKDLPYQIREEEETSSDISQSQAMQLLLSMAEVEDSRKTLQVSTQMDCLAFYLLCLN